MWTKLLIALFSFSTLAQSVAAKESGVSPSVLKLPKGPGSIEGIGENIKPNINMGLMNWGINIVLPKGHHGLSPKLRLSYSSSTGRSIVGIGWSFNLPFIERMTAKKLPVYDSFDQFAENGSSELVHIGSGVYRSKFEAEFKRYTWIDPKADGKNGYWLVEYPDGKRAWFGAYSTGKIDANAVVKGPDGTFRYHLVEMQDSLGHKLIYQYTNRWLLQFSH